MHVFVEHVCGWSDSAFVVSLSVISLIKNKTGFLYSCIEFQNFVHGYDKASFNRDSAFYQVGLKIR
jgi:hypothetical protein